MQLCGWWTGREMDMDHTGGHGKAALHSMGPVCGLYLCCGGDCGPIGGLNGQVVGVTVGLLVVLMDRLWV